MNEFQEFIAESRAINGWTPDVPKLETQDHWYVFTYAERKAKHSTYFLADDMDSKFLSLGWTKSQLYNILNVEERSGTVRLANLSGIDRVLGEVWRVSTEELMLLDADEKHSIRTQRIHIPVIISGGREVPAWMYLIDSKYLVKGGHRISLYRNYTYMGPEKVLDY